ncbi:hypothetical protein N5I82_17120 [Klebsiella quasipneumoniae]|uniref:hypothetical protein n=1 Tax=Klebsiella quasipneumoniae TaxID=1463165 RepID=UPI00103659CB|nr:hypothetical protein [Klebsiella quasipneumoniae]MCW9400494.1 hypothetical protein [Klebsiella quasipneumoniae]MDE1583635.1 hypothetical protein [Klebsiella quasipneumoniae]MDE1594389.1 hypothetical protein [Klebsiella quasipneumoniae]MDE1599736.1 hypothetical protein [Klebsiella quasipneumoniae]MDE1605097.1 hypothetical protein [Klebsiella quasipneumoniae]
MKKIKTLTAIALFMAVSFIVVQFIPIRPVVVVINNTNETIFVYAGESIYNVEPEPDEVARIVRSKPEIIAPGKRVKIKVSFISLFRKDAALDIGWRIGGQYEYNAAGGGGQNFILSTKEGVCYASIYIKDDFVKGMIKNSPGNKCFKKIKAFNYKY